MVTKLYNIAVDILRFNQRGTIDDAFQMDESGEKGHVDYSVIRGNVGFVMVF